MSRERSLWPIVARREFVERVRDRGFQVSTTITLVLLIGIIVVSALFNRPTTFDLAVVGEGSDAISRDVVAAAGALDIGVDVHELRTCRPTGRLRTAERLEPLREPVHRPPEQRSRLGSLPARHRSVRDPASLLARRAA